MYVPREFRDEAIVFEFKSIYSIQNNMGVWSPIEPQELDSMTNSLASEMYFTRAIQCSFEASAPSHWKDLAFALFSYCIITCNNKLSTRSLQFLRFHLPNQVLQVGIFMFGLIKNVVRRVLIPIFIRIIASTPFVTKNDVSFVSFFQVVLYGTRLTIFSFNCLRKSEW